MFLPATYFLTGFLDSDGDFNKAIFSLIELSVARRQRRHSLRAWALMTINVKQSEVVFRLSSFAAVATLIICW